MLRMLRIVCLSCLAGAFPGATDNLPAAELAEELRTLDGRVILRGTTSRNPMASMLSRFVEAELRAANWRDLAAWRQIESKAAWEQLREARMSALRRSLGTFPDVPQDLKVRVKRTIQGDGFEIDNLVYESRPGVVVTANLYRTGKAAAGKKMPGVVVCHSHLRPKEQGARQLMGATWARAGCTVLIPDHPGHGERRQHPFASESDYGRPFNVASQDYYFRYDAGIQLHLIGESLMGWLVWDLSRAIDVLLDRPGVDPERIVMISEPAGGGDVAAVTAALDGRIGGVMVNNFGGPEPENGYPLPPDAELSFPYATSGSWESTRNLRLSARDGFLPWTIVAAVAPRRLIYYHEFYWDQAQDPVWKRLQTVFGFYGADDALSGLAGHGFVVGSSPENTHWTPESRALLYPVLQRWFDIPNPKQEYGQLLPEEQLLCLADAPHEKGSPLHRLCYQIGEQRTHTARQELARLPAADRKAALRKQWSGLLGSIDASGEPVVSHRETELRTGLRVERIQLHTEPGIVVPMLLLLPESTPPRRFVVAIGQEGKQAFLEHRSQQLAELLKAGAAVCLPDLRGTGETDPGDGRERSSAATSLSSSELMLGETLAGSRLRDLRQVVRFLRNRSDANEIPIALWGDSFAPVNGPVSDFSVPHNVSGRPQQSEPLGGMLALLAALFDDGIEAVYVHRGLAGFQDVLMSPFCFVPHDVVIPGMLAVGDLCDLAAAVAPRPLRLDGLVDARNRSLSEKESREIYRIAISSYRAAGASQRLILTENAPSIAAWLSQMP